MQYEINFLVLQSKTEQLEKIQAEVKQMIEKAGGKITDQLFYQKRKLAYEIKHERYGFYSVFRFEIEDNEQNPLKELKNQLNLYANVVRYLIVRADELPALQKPTDQAAVREKQAAEPAEKPVARESKPDTAPTETKDEAEKPAATQAAKPAVEVEAKEETAPAERKSAAAKPEETEPVAEEKEAVAEPKETPVEKTEEPKEVTGKEEKSEPAEEAATKKEEAKEKEETTKPEEKTEEKPAEEKDAEPKRRPAKKQASLEDLDKKLDEILDI